MERQLARRPGATADSLAVTSPGRPTASTTGTYVYGVMRSRNEPVVPSRLKGLPRTGAIRPLSVADDIWLIVANAPSGHYSAEAIERGLRDLDWVSACAGRHESVVERLAAKGTFAPTKLFTIFENDARARASIGSDLARIEAVLDRIEGRHEWGVRVLLDEGRALSHARERSPKTVGRARGTGATFLARKKAERDAARTVLLEGRRAMGGVFTAIARQADAARRRGPTPAEAGTRLLLDAAFLVAIRDTARFKSAVDKIGRDIGRRGYDLTLTGPWPPYSFVGERE